MKAKSVWDIVKELLHRHDCVIVPGFGGFVCNREPSRIDQVSHVITPPARRVIFNQNLKTNDGLLAGRMAEVLKLSYNEALAEIDRTIERTRDLLQDKKQLEIELFGTFRLNTDANYVFLPDRHNNYLTSSYGLIPFQAQTVGSRTIRAAKARVFRDRKSVRSAGKKKRSISRGVLVATALALLIGINGFIFLKDHRLGDLQISSMNFSAWFDTIISRNKSVPAVPSRPVITAPVDKAEPTSSTDLAEFGSHISTSQHATPYVAPSFSDTVSVETGVVEASSEENNVLAAFAKHIGSVPHSVPPVVEALVEMTPEPVVTGRSPLTVVPSGHDTVFYVIGGVFCKERNARKYFHELEAKGFHPVVVENASIHCNRVSYGSFSSRREAQRFLSEIHSENPGAWLLAGGTTRTE